MGEHHTIKRQVEQLLHEGLKLDRIWHYMQVDNPGKSISWNYLSKIRRDWARLSLPSQSRDHQ